MPFFDVPSDDQLPPESLRVFKHWRRIAEREVSPTWRTYGRLPRILEARLATLEKLHEQSSLPKQAGFVAAMLIAHFRRCRVCFNVSRLQLSRLGFDEAAMDAMCMHPESLPLGERERRFVHFALKVAAGPADLTPKDFREMAEHGFSREEVQDIIGFVAFWVMNTIFSTAAYIALAEE